MTITQTADIFAGWGVSPQDPQPCWGLRFIALSMETSPTPALSGSLLIPPWNAGTFYISAKLKSRVSEKPPSETFGSVSKWQSNNQTDITSSLNYKYELNKCHLWVKRRILLKSKSVFFCEHSCPLQPGPFQGPDFISPEFDYHLHKVRIHNAELSSYPSPLSFIA